MFPLFCFNKKKGNPKSINCIVSLQTSPKYNTKQVYYLEQNIAHNADQIFLITPVFPETYPGIGIQFLIPV